ncbi:MmgE/PrpD family protein [Rhodoplanes sp. TEM]|uniref:MmgE/PrpD family protein n=1 Tax=Rhodoplanes tepidamans TaxID=200616 RepID=A0ABT5J7D6_RHOTP|nr:MULTISPECIES: MmgE/PrpD family protein [Rhodoplanes]MDC7785534.1 MmgE/PrpD family protein [Rhodoplanes tepidamans]MDC7986184.1 MmgE/PrpD family protein [Rhodoplanes sp. TEM]MDQ0353296.1 2-methylcitrate dehydratase PrpD [Rhodoplanes tepidamans]
MTTTLSSSRMRPLVAERLGAFVSGVPARDIPAAAIATARRGIVDAIGVAFAGTRMPVHAAVRSVLAREAAPGPCTVIGGGRLAATAAAHLNAVGAHSLDFDANYSVGMLFGPAVLSPVLLAAAEERGAAGADVLAAFAIGTEIAQIVARSLSGVPYSKAVDGLYGRGWFNSAVLGPISAAAAAARLMRLDARRAADAIAIAAVQAGGLRIAVGSDMKPALCGRAAETGLRAALMAEAGVEAPADAFEGSRGLVQVVGGGAWDEAVLDVLGAFADPGISFKLHPACSSVQAAVEAVGRLMATEAFAARDVVRVVCEVTPHIAANLAFPRPENVTQAQFSMPFAVACRLLHGRLGADMLTMDVVRDRAVRTIMDKVEMRRSADFDSAEMRARAPEATRVIVTLADGRSVSHLQLSATGKPENPMPDADLDGKFLDNVSPFLGADGAGRLLAALRALDTLADMRDVFGPPHGPEAGR